MPSAGSSRLCGISTRKSSPAQPLPPTGSICPLWAAWSAARDTFQGRRRFHPGAAVKKWSSNPRTSRTHRIRTARQRQLLSWGRKWRSSAELSLTLLRHSSCTTSTSPPHFDIYRVICSFLLTVVCVSQKEKYFAIYSPIIMIAGPSPPPVSHCRINQQFYHQFCQHASSAVIEFNNIILYSVT